MFRLSVALWALALSAQELPRHGVIGLQVGGMPLTVQRVIAGVAGEAAGFQNGDFIEALDGQMIATAEQFARGVGRHLAGEAIRVRLRSGVERTAVLKPRPLEGR